MAWSAPMTAIANTVFTAAQFNQHVRDNLNETAPAKATAAGSYFVATGTNAIAQRTGETSSVLSTETTTSMSYTDLTTIGPSVTVETGPSAIVIVHATLSNSGTGSARMAYEVSGATSITPADNRGIGILDAQDSFITASGVALHTGGLSLTPGMNTFTAKYRVSASTGTFLSRRIVVLPL